MNQKRTKTLTPPITGIKSVPNTLCIVTDLSFLHQMVTQIYDTNSKPFFIVVILMIAQKQQLTQLILAYAKWLQ